jgi:hypothetical protein
MTMAETMSSRKDLPLPGVGERFAWSGAHVKAPRTTGVISSESATARLGSSVNGNSSSKLLTSRRAAMAMSRVGSAGMTGMAGGLVSTMRVTGS